MHQVSGRRSQGSRRTGSPPGGDELGVLIGALYEVGGRARRANTGDPVDPGGMRVLVWAQHLGSPRPSELAQELRLDLSTVSRHVRALSDEGYLRSEPDAEDGRAQRISVTEQGAEAVRVVLESRRAAIGAALAHWPADDMTRLTELLRRLADDLAEANR